MNDNKSSGPDGYGSCFYKAAWPIIGEEIFLAIKDFFKTGKLLKQINATQLALIPKVQNPEKAGDYRPMACCNILYKAISKILCNRMRKVLHTLIAQNQSTFVENRSIMENILVCQDHLKHYNRKNASPRCLMKIDLRKAYDTLN